MSTSRGVQDGFIFTYEPGLGVEAHVVDPEGTLFDFYASHFEDNPGT